MVEATALHWTFKFFDAVVKHVQEQVGGEPYSGNGLMFLFSMEDHDFNSKQNDRRYSQIMKVLIEHEGSQIMKVLKLQMNSETKVRMLGLNLGAWKMDYWLALNEKATREVLMKYKWPPCTN